MSDYCLMCGKPDNSTGHVCAPPQGKRSGIDTVNSGKQFVSVESVEQRDRAYELLRRALPWLKFSRPYGASQVIREIEAELGGEEPDA